MQLDAFAIERIVGILKLVDALLGSSYRIAGVEHDVCIWLDCRIGLFGSGNLFCGAAGDLRDHAVDLLDGLLFFFGDELLVCFKLRFARFELLASSR